MASKDATYDSAGNPPRDFGEFWGRYLASADLPTRTLLLKPSTWQRPDLLSEPELDTISQAMDGYLRSEVFLESMRDAIAALIAAKRQAVCSDGREADGDATPGGSPSVPEALKPLWLHFLEGSGPTEAVSRSNRGASDHEVVYQAGSLRVLRYAATHPRRYVEPVLICFSLVNRPYILDLQADRSVVRQLLAAGFDVYLIDWGVPDATEHVLRMDDYVSDRIRRVAEVVRSTAGAGGLNLLGYCMGGTMSVLFAARFPYYVRNLILLATPIDFRTGDSLLNLWTQEAYFDVDGLIDAFGNCPGALLKIGFQQTKPVENYVRKYLNLRQRCENEAFLENFFAMERWANDDIPVAGETFREFVKLYYQRNYLVQGKIMLGDIPVELQSIYCPVLLLTADRDHLVPPASSLVLADLVSSPIVEHFCIDSGHLGLAVSHKSQRSLWPKVTDWMGLHSTRF